MKSSGVPVQSIELPAARPRWSVLVAAAAPVIMLVAAAGKLMAWDTFIDSLATFSLVGSGTRAAAAVLVPVAEVVPIALLLSRRIVLANVWSLGLLVLFSAMIAWHWVNQVPPTCSCLGLWADYLEVGRTARGALIRNGAIAAVAIVGVWLSMRAVQHRQVELV